MKKRKKKKKNIKWMIKSKISDIKQEIYKLIYGSIENAIAADLYRAELKEEKKWKPDEGSTLLEFDNRMRKEKIKFKIWSELKYYCQEHPKETRDIVLEFYNKSILLNDKACYVGCLLSPENHDLIPFFAKELVRYANVNKLNKGILCDMYSNFFLYSKNIKYKETYLEILNNDKLESERWGTMYVCGELKIEEAIPKLIELTKEKGMIIFALKSLKKYKKIELLPIFKKYVEDKDTEIRNMSKAAVASLEKKQQRLNNKIK